MRTQGHSALLIPAVLSPHPRQGSRGPAGASWREDKAFSRCLFSGSFKSFQAKDCKETPGQGLLSCPGRMSVLAPGVPQPALLNPGFLPGPGPVEVSKMHWGT